MRHGAIELTWADGDYAFRLGLAEIEELEQKRDVGLFQMATRLSPELRTCKLADISETIRLGLIGGGMKPVEALAKVRRYVDERPFDENRDTAYAIVLAGLTRTHTTEPASGEAGAAETSVSTSPPSTEAQP